MNISPLICRYAVQLQHVPPRPGEYSQRTIRQEECHALLQVRRTFCCQQSWSLSLLLHCLMDDLRCTHQSLVSLQNKSYSSYCIFHAEYLIWMLNLSDLRMRQGHLDTILLCSFENPLLRQGWIGREDSRSFDINVNVTLFMFRG